MEEVILVDIDGTIANNKHRDPYDESKVLDDKPIEHVIKVVEAMYRCGYGVIFMSGRREKCREDTKKWILQHTGVDYFNLFMRPRTHEGVQDRYVKQYLYETYIEDKYKVVGVFDDRKSVVELWRDHFGLTTFQVAWGNF